MNELGIGWTVRIEFGRYHALRGCQYCRGRGTARDLSHCLCVSWKASSTHTGKVERVLREGARSAIIQLDSETVVVDSDSEIRVFPLREL